MKTIIVITGAVSSGKSTLAKALSIAYALPWHSSDAIRNELSGDLGGSSRGISKTTGKPFDVFVTLKERVEKDIKVASVIADSTGMSGAFRKDLEEWKNKFKVVVIKLTCDYKVWTEREPFRDDRLTLKNGQLESFKMPQRAWEDSSVAIKEADLEIDTSKLTSQEVFDLVIKYLKDSIT